MNCKQRGILFVGVIIFCIANIWAPWQWTHISGGELVKMPTARYCIFETPSIEGGGLEVDMPRAILQSASIIALFGGLMVVAGCKKLN